MFLSFQHRPILLNLNQPIMMTGYCFGIRLKILLLFHHNQYQPMDGVQKRVKICSIVQQMEPTMFSNTNFVDTSVWFSLLVPHDPYHHLIKSSFQAQRTRFITTDYILDELLTLLRSQGEFQRTLAAWSLLHSSRLITLLHISASDIEAAWEVFYRFHDKSWSFTDCTSKHIIDTHQVQVAWSLDHHFRQFGTTVILPS